MPGGSIPFFKIHREESVKDARSLADHFLDFCVHIKEKEGQVLAFAIFVFEDHMFWADLHSVMTDDDMKFYASESLKRFAQHWGEKIQGYAFASEAWALRNVNEGDIVAIELGLEPRVRDREDRSELVTVSAEWRGGEPVAASRYFTDDNKKITWEPTDYTAPGEGVFVNILKN